MLELATLISRQARFRPDALAVVFGDRRLTYAQLGTRVARAANLLRSLGVGPGDKVATVLTNSLESVELIWAVPAVGAALVPLSPLLMPAGLASLLLNDRVAARYQSVSEVVILQDFPRSAAGKTLKREMREPFWAGRERKI